MLALLLKKQARDKEQQRRIAIIQQQDASQDEKPHAEKTDICFDKPWDELQRMLSNDLACLKTLAGSEEKAPFKDELIKKYAPYVTQLLETHNDLSGLDIIFWWYLWQIDNGRMMAVHDDFKAAIERGLDTPPKWSSNAQTAFCDLVFRYSFESSDENPSEQRFLLSAVDDLIAGRLATNAPLKVKMFRLAGDWHLAAGNKQAAIAMFEWVMNIDPKKGGRKTKLQQLKEELT